MDRFSNATAASSDTASPAAASEASCWRAELGAAANPKREDESGAAATYCAWCRPLASPPGLDAVMVVASLLALGPRPEVGEEPKGTAALAAMGQASAASVNGMESGRIESVH